jgi:Cupin domain
MPAAPQVVWMPGGVRTEIHLGGADTGGSFCLLVDHPPAGWSLPAHLHADAAETIHVLAGEFEMSVDGNSERLGAGPPPRLAVRRLTRKSRRGVPYFAMAQVSNTAVPFPTS